PSAGRRRLVAYVKPAYPYYSLVIRALARCKADVFLVSPQGPRGELQAFAGPIFGFGTRISDLPSALAKADLFVGHGNAGSTRESLVAGVPVMVLPIQLEQLLTGGKVQALGVGRLVERLTGEEELVEQLNDVLAQTEIYRQSITQLLASYSQPYLAIQQTVVDACRDLLGTQYQ